MLWKFQAEKKLEVAIGTQIKRAEGGKLLLVDDNGHEHWIEIKVKLKLESNTEKLLPQRLDGLIIFCCKYFKFKINTNSVTIKLWLKLRYRSTWI